jgi:hypothetical protein
MRWLQPLPGEAINFWATVAADRKVDPKSIISEGGKFTALPVGHGLHWCAPMSLKCKKKAVYRD